MSVTLLWENWPISKCQLQNAIELRASFYFSQHYLNYQEKIMREGTHSQKPQIV